MDKEVIEKVLEFNIKVQTNTGKEKSIRFSNIDGFIDSSLSYCNDDCDGLAKVKFAINCLGYTMEIIDE